MAAEDQDPVVDEGGVKLRYSERALLDRARGWLAEADELGAEESAHNAQAIIDVVERLGRVRAGKLEETSLVDAGELRDALIRELAWFVEEQKLDGLPVESVDVEVYASAVAPVRTLAAAIESLDRVAYAASQAAPPGAQVSAPVDVNALSVEVWNATQDAGGSTAVGDAAVAAIRKAMGHE